MSRPDTMTPNACPRPRARRRVPIAENHSPHASAGPCGLAMLQDSG